MNRYKLVLAVALALATAPAMAGTGPYVSGSFVTTFVGTPNDGSGDAIIASNSLALRVPAALPVKYSGGLTELAIGEQIKFASTATDENNVCIADFLEARPAQQSSGNSKNKVRGGE
jgi:hypothetical protein